MIMLLGNKSIWSQQNCLPQGATALRLRPHSDHAGQPQVVNLSFFFFSLKQLLVWINIQVIFPRGTDDLSSFLLSSADMKQWEVTDHQLSQKLDQSQTQIITYKKMD